MKYNHDYSVKVQPNMTMKVQVSTIVTDYNASVSIHKQLTILFNALNGKGYDCYRSNDAYIHGSYQVINKFSNTNEQLHGWIDEEGNRTPCPPVIPSLTKYYINPIRNTVCIPDDVSAISIMGSILTMVYLTCSAHKATVSDIIVHENGNSMQYDSLDPRCKIRI